MFSEKEELNLKMSIDITNRQTAAKYNLAIDEDTAFTIYFDIYKYGEEKEYLYFKMQENTALAPFFYDVSYVKDELIKIHPIFKSVDMDQAKEHLESLFNNKMVKLHYANEEKTEITMEIESIWFIKKIKIPFELNKEMEREEEKNDLMIRLYNINKKKKKLAKLLNASLKQNEGAYKNIIDMLLTNFDLDEIANNSADKDYTNDGHNDNDNNNDNNNEDSRNYDRENLNMGESLYNSNANNDDNDQREDIIIENKENNENDEEYIEKMKSIFTKNKKASAKKCEIGYKAKMTFVNKSKKVWPIGYIKFKIDKEKSKTLCKDDDIIYPDYEIGPTQDGDFYVVFDENAPKGNYSCTFDVYIGGNKLENAKIELTGKIKSE